MYMCVANVPILLLSLVQMIINHAVVIAAITIFIITTSIIHYIERIYTLHCIKNTHLNCTSCIC